MKQIIKSLMMALVCLVSGLAQAEVDKTRLAVWANEAIVATYTYDYKDYLNEQKKIAHYFTAKAWMDYSKALIDSGLPQSVQTNQYQVSAVSTLPPVITSLPNGGWKAVMPVLVVYSNPQYQQKQELEVSLYFSPAPSGQGVRGLAIDSLQSKLMTSPCVCKPVSAQENEKKDLKEQEKNNNP